MVKWIAIALVLAQPCLGGVPRPEHPFPQAARAQWLNLNGVWEFAETDESADAPYLADNVYPDKIVVPFCRESRLSGLERKGFVKHVWYRRKFELPKTWRSARTILHVGACDYRTRVWLNGTFLGEHVGGSAPFSFEITRTLKPGANTLIISAYDDNRSGLQAAGKQSPRLESFGCMYTRTTGIWQTVWLEGVGSTYVRDFHIEPDPSNSRVIISAEIDGSARCTLTATAWANGRMVGKAAVPAAWRDTKVVLRLSQRRLWSVQDPFLYRLRLELTSGGKTIDAVDSYFGLRSVSIRGAAILINGKPVFQRLVLDQGYYPDGVWTAPTDGDLRRDIEISKALGFNGARLHQKVFEPRYLYWADKLGYLVWAEFPSWGPDYANPAVDRPFIDEWVDILRRDRNHPCIVGWCPLNETSASAGELQKTIVKLTRMVDPSRPVIDTSGYIHSVAEPDVLDAHDYDQNPATFRSRWCDSFGPNAAIPARYAGGSGYVFVPFMVSEYGGIGWTTSGGWGYGASPKTLEEFYARYAGLTNALLDNPFMFGFCYTQIYDVEQEQNGMYTYDRKPKFDAARIRAINSRQAACESTPVYELSTPLVDRWTVLVGAAPDTDPARCWRYTLERPEGDWTKPDYDDSAWQQGLGGFGDKAGWEWAIRTTWKTSDIWLRQAFAYDGAPIERALLVAHCDNDTSFYLNGKLIRSLAGWNDRYDGFDVTESLRKAIKAGTNVIAIHCRQHTGGQFIDAALLVAKQRF